LAIFGDSAQHEKPERAWWVSAFFTFDHDGWRFIWARWDEKWSCSLKSEIKTGQYWNSEDDSLSRYFSKDDRVTVSIKLVWVNRWPGTRPLSER
jgi:hypothetical protein